MAQRKNKSQKIIFSLPEEITIIDVIDGILKDNGLAESDREFFDTSIQGDEPKLIIVRDAAYVLAEQKIPEKKLIELLEKHLHIKKHAAENIIRDVKEKLIPFAKIVTPEDKELQTEGRRQDTQEVLLEKIRANKIPVAPPKIVLPQGPKKVEVADVEKNAERMKPYKKFDDVEKNVIEEKDIKKFDDNRFANEKKGPDSYREPIE